MARMVAIGPEQFTLPFGAMGFEMIEAEQAEFLDVLRGLLRDKSVALIVCGESFVASVIDEFRQLSKTARAAVLAVPDGPKVLGLGREIIRASIERAAGVDLLGSEQE